MNRILPLTGIVLLTLIFSCRKKHTNSAHCQSCTLTAVAHPMDSDSVFYFLPTAFTPNGDGRNDVYGLSYYNVIPDSSTITIWNIGGTEVFNQNITARWEGIDEAGHQCPAGTYPVRLQLLTKTGAKLDICTCVALLHYSGSCLKTDGVTYYFYDQVNPTKGFVFPTNETLCP